VTTTNLARAAYARPETPARSPRTIEYDLLARSTQALSAAWPDRATNFPALAVALDNNLRLWSALGTDVLDSENGLPAPLRAQLFYLYEFTANHSRAVLDGRADVAVLVDINTAVMRGLRGDGGKA
jgi:flagellar biosynthesis activator protein FlaF